jgi:hypothetical protein
MAEVTKEQEIQKVNAEQLGKVQEAMDKLKGKKNKFLFFVSQTNNPAASIYEVYFHATTVKNMGYNVKILTDSKDYVVPEWIESEMTDFEHMSMDNAKLSVGPEDVLVIPEVFSNVMEQTKNLPCIRIGLLQSIDYMLNALVPATDWSTFGVDKIITTSNNSKEMVETFFGKNKFDIKVYDIGIPNYFAPAKEPKRLVISLVGRNPNEVAKIIKLFYAKYPEYNFVTFDSMLTDSKPPKPLSRIDYAERLGKNFAGVWIDRIASFGTFPLECMKSGTIPIAIVPDIVPEYLLDENGEVIENSGVWTQDLYALPLLIGDVITKYLDDSIEDEVYETMSKVSEKYSQDNATKQLQEIYQGFIDERIGIFERTIQISQPIEEVTEQK